MIKNLSHFNKLLILLSLSFILAGCGDDNNSPVVKEQSKPKTKTIYATWPLWEADRVASIWLIKRFVDPNADFIFVNKGDSTENAIPFDMPEAKYQRKHNQACFQIILLDQKITRPDLNELAKLIWDIEINFWGEKKFEQSNVLKAKLDEVFAKKLPNHEIVDACCAIFDEYIKQLNEN